MKKSTIFTLAIIIFVACCDDSPKYLKAEGFAQGTTWHITYKSPNGENLQSKFEEILSDFDNSMSTYNQKSLITKINNNETNEVDENFRVVFESSQEIFRLSDGLFDPTCRPLVNAWGFGKHEQFEVPTQSQIDSILEFVGLDKLKIENNKLIKADPRITVNFNANAQGYSVDLICNYLQSIGCCDFVVEVGGETRTLGKNPSGNDWRIGIDSPIDGNENYEIHSIVTLSGKAICTSGNYRNYFVKDGKKYAHELNAKTGYPTEDSLLAVSLITDEALFGDGLATAVMVMGLHRGFQLVDSLPNVEGYFIYSDSKGNFQELKTAGFHPIPLNE